jgi:DNA-binding transcriptional MerR regulator
MKELLAFSVEQAARLTGLSVKQISHLDNKGVLTPTYAEVNRRRPFSRIYSFRDIVALRTIAILRQKHGISLQELRSLSRWLAENYQTPWSSLRFFVSGDRLFFRDPITGAVIASQPTGQLAMPFVMDEVVRDVSSRADRLRQRATEEIGRVERRRNVAHNAFVIAGTRIPTAAIYDFHRADYDIEAIIREYPRLTKADVEAAIAHEEQRQHARAS